MPITNIIYSNYYPMPPGGVPAAPTNVTSITKDAGATVSFLAPPSSGSSLISSWTVTPYIGASAQSPTTVSAGSAGSITGSNGNTYVQVNVTGLTNNTAYTFTAKATNSIGTGPESAHSGANTPLSGLVFGDDFNGSANGPIDPEWWVYNNRCGYLAQNEVEAYSAANCVLDGSSNLKLTAQHTSITVPRYPSDPQYPGNITQPWTSGACQSNTRTYAPSTNNTMTFEVRQKVMADAGNGFWPGFLWLEGQAFLTQWKTDPNQPGHNNTNEAEIDIAEWPSGQASTTQFVESAWDGSAGDPSSFAPAPGGGYDATTMNTYKALWKPSGSGVSPFVTFWLNGTQEFSATHIPVSGAQFFLLIYLQMVAGGPTTTESCFVDYVHVFDQNLG